MKKLFFFLLFIPAFSYSQTKNSAVNPDDRKQIIPKSDPTPDVVKLPDGFPKFVNTGSADNDLTVYQTAKQDWFTANPAKGKEFLDSRKDVRTVTVEEFKALPQLRKDQILAHPELYDIK